MAATTFLDLYRHPWFSSVSSDVLEVAPRSKWLADVALAKAGFFAAQLADGPGKRQLRDPSLRSSLAVIGYAYFLPDLVDEYESFDLLSGSAGNRIRAVVKSVSPDAAEVLQIDRTEGAPVAARFCRAVSSLVEEFGVKRFPSGIEAAPRIFGAVAGTNAGIGSLIDDGMFGRVPPQERDPRTSFESSSGSTSSDDDDEVDDEVEIPPGPLALYLTGDALGFEGANQLRVDLCLAFGVSFASHVADLAGPVVSEAKEVLTVVGFLAATPLLDARWEIDLLHAEPGQWQLANVARAAGLPFRRLVRVLDGGDVQGWLTRLSLAARDALLSGHGVSLDESVVLQMPLQLTYASAFIDDGAGRLGVN